MSTNTSRGKMSPYQFDTGKVPNVSHLRVWGCKVWAHIPKDKRYKDFNSKALVGYLMGYSEHQRGAYIVWVPELNGLIVSRDGRFDEDIPQGVLDPRKDTYFYELRRYNINDHDKRRNVEYYDYLIDNVYYDTDEDLQCLCLVTRIEILSNNDIVGYFKRIVNNIPEEEEYDCIHVAEIERMIGTYMEVEDLGDERQSVNVFEDNELYSNN